MTNQQLSVGNVQTFVFSEEDEGPFYLNKEEHEKQRYDKLLGKKPKPKTKTKQDLRKEMIDKDPMCNIKGNAEKLQERAKLMGITLEKIEPNVLEGWMGKAKGMKQVAFERGLLDLANVHLYSKDGPKDDDGNIIDESFSLKKIISSLTDFVEEETMLQHMTGKLAAGIGINVIIDRTPKCHPELAGEGIEYTWANSKIYLRGVPVKSRKSKLQFHKHVRLALSRYEGARLNREKVRKFSARARDFIVAYNILEQKGVGESASSLNVLSLTKVDI